MMPGVTAPNHDSRITHHASRIIHHASRITHHSSRLTALHQNLTQLQPIAERVAKGRDAHDARNFLNFTFELDALRSEFILSSIKIIHPEHDRSAGFIITL